MNKSPVARLGGSWIWHLLYGLVSIGTGIIAVAWPGPTLIVLAVVFGVQLITTGVFRLVGSASLGEAGTARALTAILGVVSLLLGLYALRHVLITVLALGLLLGIYWIVDGFTAVFSAVDHPGLPGRGWNIFIGLLGVIAGLMLLAWPSLSLLTLSFLAGLWLIMLGAMQLGLARRAQDAQGSGLATWIIRLSGGRLNVTGDALPHDGQHHQRPVPLVPERQAGELLDPGHPVQQRVAVHRQRGRGRRAVEAAGGQAPQRDGQVRGFGPLQRAEDPPDEPVGEFR